MPNCVTRIFYWVFVASIGLNGCLLQSLHAQVAADDLAFALLHGESFSVTEIAQGRDGFLWVASTTGLLRYDGYGFREYRHWAGDSTSLANNYINSNALVEDASGHLWIGTREGLSRLDPATNTFTNYYHDRSQSGSLSDNWVNHVLLSRSGEIWVGTNDGLNRYDSETNAFRHYRYNPEGPTSIDNAIVASLAEDAAGHIWIGTARGLNRLDPETGFVEHFPLPFAGKLWSLLVDSNGQIWAGTEKGVLFKSDSAGAFEKIDLFKEFDVEERGGFVIDLFEDASGQIWVGTWNGGLFVFDEHAATWTRAVHRNKDPQSLPENSISDFYEDRSGKMWIGTWTGLAHVRDDKPFGHLDLAGLSITRATSVDVDAAGNTWVGTAGGGVWGRVAESGETFRMHQKAPGHLKLSADRVSSVLIDQAGRIWIGTSGGGINRYDPRTGEMTRFYHAPSDASSLPSNLIYKIYEDRTGRIWVGTVDAGLALFDENTRTFTPYATAPGNMSTISSNEIWTIYEGLDARMWIGTMGGGLYEMLIEDNGSELPQIDFRAYQYRDSSSISSNDVVALHQDTAGNLWIGTMGGGLNKMLAGTSTFKHFGMDEGLPDDNVGCIQPDDNGNLWLSTRNGLSRFNPVQETFTNYIAADGLVSMVFFLDGCKKSASGKLYFANAAGVTVFDPDAIMDNRVPPEVALTEVMLFNKPLVMDSAATHKRFLKLPHDQNFLSFTFTALNFIIPEKNRYRYKLDGLDANWVEAGTKRNADYPNLQPGAYTLQVQAANNDGIWSLPTALIHLEIGSPFWQTLWFQLFMLAVLGSFAWAVYDSRKRKRLELDRVRQQIADDLHDDIGGNLSALVMFLKRISGSTDLNSSDQASARLYLFSVHRMMADLRDAIWMTDPGDDSLSAFVERLELTANKLIQGNNLDFEHDGIEKERKTGVRLRRHFYLIYKEILHNIAQHAEATEVTIRVTLKENRFQLTVRDNGKGFDLDTTRKGRGMNSMRRRAEQWHFEFDLESEPEKGTFVLLSTEI